MATIRVDLDRRIGAINPLIYGSFIEHLGRCSYDGIVDAESAAQGEYAPRADTLDAVGGLRVPILRWPGGNFVSGYHWLDSVGVRAYVPGSFAHGPDAPLPQRVERGAPHDCEAA